MAENPYLSLLRHISDPSIDGVPGALDPNEVGPQEIGPLLLADMIRIDAINPMDDPAFAEGTVNVTYAHARVFITETGKAELENPKVFT